MRTKALLISVVCLAFLFIQPATASQPSAFDFIASLTSARWMNHITGSQSGYLVQQVYKQICFPLFTLGFIYMGLKKIRRKPESPSDDRSLECEAVAGENHVQLRLVHSKALEATLRVRFSGENFNCDDNPEYIKIAGGEPRSLVTVLPVDGDKTWDCWYETQWIIGVEGADPNLDFTYSLPFARGNSYRVTLADHEKSHSSLDEQYAIDFAMPVDSVVCAARSGVVVAVRDDSTAYGRSQSYNGSANYIVIKHADGTYAKYCHIKKASARVRVGDEVRRWQPIARIGINGYTNGPHLHFCVYHVEGMQRVSIPVKFNTAYGVLARLSKNEYYSHA